VQRILSTLSIILLAQGAPFAQTPPAAQHPPVLPFSSSTDFLKVSPDMNFGEVLSVAVNSKGHVVVLNHPGSATSGPLYGNATTQLWEFDAAGKFLREIGKGVYGLGYGHSVRFDKYDNLWVVDKGTNSVMKFNPAGYVVMNFGRRPEGYDSYAGEYERPKPKDARAVDGMFNGVTDVAWDAQDNIYISDGYVNSRVAKYDKNGNWIKTWGEFGESGVHASENPSHFRTPHNIQVDRQGNVYVADRGNRRIQVFDGDGRFLRYIHLTAPYDKKRHPVLGNALAEPPDETAPWALCITTTGPTQYMFVSDNEPGRIYKMTLDGKIVGMFGESGRGPKQFNWVHGIACPTENDLYLADMNNWRVQKISLAPGATKSTAEPAR
jgi:hypothetical protein